MTGGVGAQTAETSAATCSVSDARLRRGSAGQGVSGLPPDRLVRRCFKFFSKSSCRQREDGEMWPRSGGNSRVIGQSVSGPALFWAGKCGLRGVLALAESASLKKVTEATVARLKKARPNLEITLK